MPAFLIIVGEVQQHCNLFELFGRHDLPRTETTRVETLEREHEQTIRDASLVPASPVVFGTLTSGSPGHCSLRGPLPLCSTFLCVMKKRSRKTKWPIGRMAVVHSGSRSFRESLNPVHELTFVRATVTTT